MTIYEGYQMYLAMQYRSLGKEGTARYRSWLDPFLQYMLQHDQDPVKIRLDQLDLMELWRYVRWLMDIGYSRSSVRTFQIALKSMLSYLQISGFLSHDFDLGSFQPIVINDSAVVLTADQIDRIGKSFRICHVLDERDYCIVHLLLLMGLSVREICWLRYEDVNFQAGYLDIDTRSSSRLEIPPDLLDHMIIYNNLVGAREFFFVSRYGGQIGYELIKKIMQRLQDRTDIDRLTVSRLHDTYQEVYKHDASGSSRRVFIYEASAGSSAKDHQLIL